MKKGSLPPKILCVRYNDEAKCIAIGTSDGVLRILREKSLNVLYERSGEERVTSVAYVFFNLHSHSHLFDKIDIQPTYMHKYSSSLSLVAHSLLHMLIQVISHTHVTLEPQDVGNLVSISSCRIGIE